RTGLCVIFTSREASSAIPLRSVWLQLDVERLRCTVYTPGSALTYFPLIQAGLIAKVPDEVSNSLSLPPIVVALGRGMITSSALAIELDRFCASLGLNSNLLLAGCCHWLDGGFISSPLGDRCKDGSWRSFAPAGGLIALDIQWPPLQIKGTLLSELPEENFGRNLLHATVDLFGIRCPILASVFYCPCDSMADAVTLVVMRMAWGSLRSIIEIPRSADPAWRRLMQHLGADPRKVEEPDKDSLSIQGFTRHLASQDYATLMKEINFKSRIIPEGLLPQGSS
ncbi:MAG: hypothetical protein NTV34_14090, partial [Proteobacteria bacterium]|nr:hypothetical protein [Pseudomonadota bacterium]